MTTFRETINLTYHVVSCYTCGVTFAIEGDLYRRAVTDARGSVYCPACGKGTSWRESDDARKIRQLKQQLESSERRTSMANRRAELANDAKEAAENSLRATKGVVTKMKKRAAAGVCPCCNRTFQDLANHMKSKHPDFVQDQKG